MGLCLCCLDEGERVDLVMSRFEPVATYNSINVSLDAPSMLVGTVVSASQMHAPADGRPCVYFKFVIEKEEERTSSDSDGSSSTSYHWEQIRKSEQGADFVIRDRTCADVFVHGDHSFFDIDESRCEFSRWTTIKGFPVPERLPGVAVVLREIAHHKYREYAANCIFFGPDEYEEKRWVEGKYRFRQRFLYVGETVSALGIVRATAASPGKQLLPVPPQAPLPAALAYGDELHRDAWRSLTRDGAILISNNQKHVNRVTWRCAHCSFDNHGDATAVCLMCGQVKRVASVTMGGLAAEEAATQAPARSTPWTCAQCTFSNRPPAARCEACACAAPPHVEPGAAALAPLERGEHMPSAPPAPATVPLLPDAH